MFKKLSVVISGLGVVLGTCGVAHAQAPTTTTTTTTSHETKAKAKQTGHTAKAETKSAAHKTGNAVSDAEITTAVKTKLLADKTVGGLKIDVDTSNGVVTLTGPVNSAAEKAQALKLAKATHGVKHVVSKLTTEPHATSKK
jgi:hyperosmotically inducible protein